MYYALKTRQMTTQESIIKNWGDKVWVELCDSFPESFTIKAMSKHEMFKHLQERTARDIVRTVLINVKDEAEEKGLQVPFRRMGQTYFWE